MDNKKKIKEECYLCGKLCAPKMLKIHIRNHTNVILYDCDECYRRFNSKKQLKAHKMLHQTKFTCEDCNRKYLTEERFKNHICTPEKLRNHICEICNKSFLSDYDLQRHFRIHTDEKPFSCHICNKSFAQKGNRDTHCRSHNKDPNRVPEVKEKKYVCGICFQSFAYKQHLNRHNFTHTGERPHVCKICHKGFIQRYHMKLHMQIHCEAMNFKCEECGKYYKCKTSLETHQKTHSEPTVFCSVCEKSFFSKSSYEVHFKTHTNTRPYTCDICHKTFTTCSSLKGHYFSHTKSKIKEKESNNVQEDILSDSRKLSSISLENNSLHSDLRLPCKCHICDKNLANKSSLRRHQLTHFKKMVKSIDKNDSTPKIFSETLCSFVKLPDIPLEEESLHRNKRTCSDDDNEKVYKYSFKKLQLFPSTNEFKSVDVANIKKEPNFDKISNCAQEKCFDEVSNNVQQNCHDETADNIQNKCFEDVDIKKEQYFDEMPNDVQKRRFDEISNNEEKCLDEILMNSPNTENKKYFNNMQKEKCFNEMSSDIQETSLEEMSNNSKSVDIYDKQCFCLVCKKVFVNDIEYENHIKEYWLENFQCCICDCVCPNLIDLKEHHKVHDISLREDQYAYLDKKRYSCNVCGNFFATKLLLENHNLKFMQDNLQCCMCGAAFDLKADLIEHHIIHNDSFTENPHIYFISKMV